MTLKASAVVLLRAYKRWLSPLLPPSCRYWPTCSEYAREAIELHGLRRGTALALRRLARCHPWSAGGADPVPSAADRVRCSGFPS